MGFKVYRHISSVWAFVWSFRQAYILVGVCEVNMRKTSRQNIAIISDAPTEFSISRML